MPIAHNTVLFLCTGNYYRSRYAEELFNHMAVAQRLPWAAASRGLALERGVNNVGPVAASVIEALNLLGVKSPREWRHPLPVSGQDLSAAAVVVALKEEEHRPLLAERFPGWESRVRYWHVHDTDLAPVADALAQIHQSVTSLVAECSRRATLLPQAGR